MQRSNRLLQCVAWFAIVVASAATAAVGTARTEDILARQQEIRTRLDAQVGDYAKLTPAKRQAIIDQQARLVSLLTGTTDTSQLNGPKRQEVTHLMADIESEVQKADENHMVCTREARTGSNYMTRVCRTPEEARERAEYSQKWLRDEQDRTKCNGKDNLGCF